ncbi:MAG: HigA family addiction module antitoxin [Terriglobales bacterium]
MLPNSRIATHPGTILEEEFLGPLRLTQADLARALHIPVNRVNEMVGGKRGITPQSALLLAAYFGNSPEFGMNLQTAHDLSRARAEMPGKEIRGKGMPKKPVRPAAKSRARNLRAQGAD